MLPVCLTSVTDYHDDPKENMVCAFEREGAYNELAGLIFHPQIKHSWESKFQNLLYE